MPPKELTGLSAYSKSAVYNRRSPSQQARPAGQAPADGASAAGHAQPGRADVQHPPSGHVSPAPAAAAGAVPTSSSTAALLASDAVNCVFAGVLAPQAQQQQPRPGTQGLLQREGQLPQDAVDQEFGGGLQPQPQPSSPGGLADSQQQLGGNSPLLSRPATAAPVGQLSSAAPRGATAPRAGGSDPPRSTPRQPGGLYQALKQKQPAEVQEQLDAAEPYWDADGLQERRQELQQRLEEEEMVARIKRRVAGEKINLPSVPLARLMTLLTPRGQQPAQPEPGVTAQPPEVRPLPEAGPGAACGSGQQAALLGAAAVLSSAEPKLAASAQAAGPRWSARVQQAVAQVVYHPDFGLLISLLIAVNCISLALYQPQLPDDQGRNKALKTLELAMNFVFTAEVALTCVAAGGVKEYLRSPWNLFDLAMVLVGYTDFIPSGSNNTGGIRALRALRALRPLRTITRFESLRAIVVSFLEALPLLLSVFQLLFFFLVLAGIAGTILFMGSDRQACFNTVTGQHEQPDNPDFGCGARHCPANYTCTEFVPSPPYAIAGFANIGASMLTVFETITLSGWVHAMYQTMDYAGPEAFLFFVAIVLLESYFVVNLFLAVLKNKFAKAQQLFSKVVTEEGKQRSTFVVLWRALRQHIAAHSARKRAEDEARMSERTSRGSSGLSTPSMARQQAQELLQRHPSMAGRLPTTRLGFWWYWFTHWVGSLWFELRWHVRQVVEHPAFGQLFLLAIIANTVVLALTTADMSPQYAAALDRTNTALTIVFAAEVAAKLLGLGLCGFAADSFNWLDLGFAAMGLVELTLAMGANTNSLRALRTLRILRSLRVLRVLKAFRYLESLRVMTDVLLSSMGSFIAISSLMVLFIFCWAVIGLQSFGLYDLHPSFPNFHSFWYSIVLVFQVLTLENWVPVMMSVQAVAGWGSALYFVCWVAVGKWVLLTLFLAITLSAFETNYEKYSRGTTTGSVARLLGAIESAKQTLRQMRCACCRSRRIAPSTAVDSDGFTADWVAKAAAVTATERAASPVPSAGAAAAPLWQPPVKQQQQPQQGLLPLPREVLIPALRPEQRPAEEGQPPATPPSHVADMVQHFERLSPRKDPVSSDGGSLLQLNAGSEAQPARGLPPGRPEATAAGAAAAFTAEAAAVGLSCAVRNCSQADSHEPGGMGLSSSHSCSGSVMDGCGTPCSPSRQKQRRARFAEALGEEVADAEQPAPAAGSGAASPLGPAAAGAPALAAPDPGSSGLPPLGLAAIASEKRGPLVLGPPAKPVPSRQATDQSVPSELLEAEQRSEISGCSSASSASRLSRLSAAARKRSKRTDFPPLMGTSLFCFKADNRPRSFVYNLVTLHYFDYALMLVVLLSCVEMAMETPNMEPDATRTIVLRWIDVSTTIVFWLEAVLKILAFSFKAYISYFTNKVDLAVVMVSTVVLIADTLNARFLKALRVLRAIKPLRVLTRSVSMLLVFHTLARSLMEMGNVTVLCALCFLIFAILGVQLFAGLFWSCTDPTVSGKSECTSSFLDDSGALAPREWVNLPLNFDNVGNAFLALFVTATLDGYTPMMYMSMSTRSDPSLQPQMGSNPAAFLFWFFYITLVAFFVLNLYVGVVFYQFQRLKMLSQTGSVVLTTSQMGYVEMMKAVFRLKPLDKAPLPANPLRRLCHRLAYHPWFDGAMTAVIVSNIILLATTYYGEPAGFTTAKERANTAFSAIVVVECLVKVGAMGPRLYWRSNWNKFDLALTVAALVDILSQILNAVLSRGVSLGAVKKTMMLLRTLRMFKVMRRVKGLQVLLTTLVVSLPAIYNVGSLLLLLFFVYAYMGMLLFGSIAFGDSLDEHANFRSFPSAMLTLFRVAVGDDWVGLMEDCMVRPPDCTPGECGSQWAWLYFFSFYLAVGLIAFNLFTTVILETFETTQDIEAWKLTPANLDEFCELWAEYDDGTSLIDPKALEAILMRLPPPMGLGRKAKPADVRSFVYQLDIPLVDGKVPFYRTVFELVSKATSTEVPPGLLRTKLERMIRRFLHKHKAQAEGGQDDAEHLQNFAVALTVIRIQRHWRALVARRRAAAERAAARAAAGLPSQEEEGEQQQGAAAAAPAAEQQGSRVLGRLRTMLSSRNFSFKGPQEGG